MFLVLCDERLRIDPNQCVGGGSRLHVSGYIPVGVIRCAPCTAF